MSQMKKIVVGVDGSAGSLQALRWALAEARRRGDSVDVIHSWHIPYYSDTTGLAMPDPGAILQQTAHEILDGVMAEVAAEAEGLTVTSHVELGPAAQVLIDASTKADLLVVGRRGHGGFPGLVLGSVAQQVSGHASCAVVIIPTAE